MNKIKNLLENQGLDRKITKKKARTLWEQTHEIYKSIYVVLSILAQKKYKGQSD